MSIGTPSAPSRPLLICTGHGKNPIANFLCAGSWKNHERWDLEPSSRNFFYDGIVTVCGLGTREHSPKSCKSFQDYFEILYDDLFGSFEPRQIYRVIANAEQLRSASKDMKANHASNDHRFPSAKAGFDWFNSINRGHEPFGRQERDTFAYLFTTRYTERKEGGFNAEDVVGFVVKAERDLQDMVSQPEATGMCGQ